MQERSALRHPAAARIANLLAVSAVALGLAACEKMKEPTTGQKIDSALERTEQAAAAAKADAQKAMQAAQVKVEEGATKAEAAARDAEAAARQAGNSALAMADDGAITAQVSSGLAKDPDLSALKIDVDTHNGVVTLKGPAPSQAAKDRAATIAQGVKGVSSVLNQLDIKPG
ncbi:transporter [Acidovorax sp. SRB_14]|uniref:BON domain-containing protein n=1 Tax=unclassified Acidovorax TaxID=2684926 RepID=UPI00145C5094|nr:MULTISPECIES: BON domain-containing protein [unclassified Acidovorax]NMM76525.1 transporter [Acidovorax sp. SRB_24]NMM79347.1 transporter [Acidovorax sp. SRB_14]NMM84599.1 transporter [Rhodococcus sp. SRB_17]